MRTKKKSRTTTFAGICLFAVVLLLPGCGSKAGSPTAPAAGEKLNGREPSVSVERQEAGSAVMQTSKEPSEKQPVASETGAERTEQPTIEADRAKVRTTEQQTGTGGTESQTDKQSPGEQPANDAADQTGALAAQKQVVFIKAYLNLSGCQTETVELLDGLAARYKGRVSVEYIDFSTKEGFDRMVKDGLNCAGLVINGKQTHTINKNGEKKEVTFSHPMGYQYTADDVKAVVESLLAQ